jgi:hypothetical protein
VNGVCGSGATTGGHSTPGLPGGACPSGQVRGPNGCTGPKTGSTTSSGTGSTSRLPVGQNRGGGQTIMPVTGGHSGAQPMISHSGGTQATHTQSTQASHSFGGSQASHSGGQPSGHRR